MILADQLTNKWTLLSKSTSARQISEASSVWVSHCGYKGTIHQHLREKTWTAWPQTSQNRFGSSQRIPSMTSNQEFLQQQKYGDVLWPSGVKPTHWQTSGTHLEFLGWSRVIYDSQIQIYWKANIFKIPTHVVSYKYQIPTNDLYSGIRF